MSSLMDDYVESVSAEILETNLTGLFECLNGDQETMLKTLYKGNMCDIVYLVEQFQARMKKEAREIAIRSWTPTVEAFATLRAEDERSIQCAEMRG